MRAGQKVSIEEKKCLDENLQELCLKQASIPLQKREEYDLKRLNYLPIDKLQVHKAWAFGDILDGVIEMAALTSDGAIEIGYYYGDKKPKSIIKISSQIGCPASCSFCEVGDIKFKRNLTKDEIYQQVAVMVQVLSDYHPHFDELPHKINIAGTGEPLFNSEITEGIKMLSNYNFSFKVSTVFPMNKNVVQNFTKLAEFSSSYQMPVQIQLSLISLSEDVRRNQAGIKLATFDEIGELASLWRSHQPMREQINLSLILTDDCKIDVQTALKFFPPEYFRFRFRDYVTTRNGTSNELTQIKSDIIVEQKELFRKAGYSVSDDATPTATELEYGLASNVTRNKMMTSYGFPLDTKSS